MLANRGVSFFSRKSAPHELLPFATTVTPDSTSVYIRSPYISIYMHVLLLSQPRPTCHLHARPSSMSQQRLKGLQYIINVRRRRRTHEPVACDGTDRLVVQNPFVTSISARVSVAWRSTVPRVLCRWACMSARP